VDDHPGLGACGSDRFGHGGPCGNPALENAGLLAPGPASLGEIVAGEVDDGQGAVGQPSPARRRPAVPRRRLDAVSKDGADLRGVPAQGDDLAPGSEEVIGQGPSDEARGTGDNDAAGVHVRLEDRVSGVGVPRTPYFLKKARISSTLGIWEIS
jgi:hypothetical protein